MSAIHPGLASALAALPAEEFRRRLDRLDGEQQREALRHRFRHDQPLMLRWTLPGLFSRRYNRYHLSVLARPKLAWEERRGRSILRVDAAPRGIAKTTTLKGEIVHDVVYGLEKQITIVSAEARLARSITKHLRRIFLARSGRLHDLYGPFTVEGGVDEFRVTTGDGHTVGVLARSFGTQIRGANEDGARPTRIAVDDGERPDRVRNPRLREEDQQFLTDDILTCGPIDGGLIVDWRGTVLHPDAILPRLLRNPGWSGRKWRAVESWPTRTDLWAEAEAIYTDLRRGSAEERWDAAHAFYQAHREDMDAGCVLLDPVALPIFAVYVEVWTKGMRSVLRERQNEPFDPSAQVFDLERLRRCRVDGQAIHTSRGTVVHLGDCEVAIWLDPSKGDAGSDFPAIAVVARDPWGYRYVIHAEGARKAPSSQHEALWRVWGLYAHLRPTVGCDATGTQGLLATAFEAGRQERRRQGKAWGMAPILHTFRGSKVDRISGLEPDVVNGWLEFSVDLPSEVLDELRDHPNATHDDYLDAIEAADGLLCGRTSGGVVSARSLRG